MTNGGYVLFHPLPATRTKRIGSDIDIGASAILMSEPTRG